MYLYLNNELTTEQAANISVLDHGYLYGVGLFETFRTYQGCPFLLTEHLTRLSQACKDIGIEWEADEPKLRRQISILLERNNLQDGYFRLNVSAGPAPIGLRTAPYTEETETLLVKALPPKAKDKRCQTVSLRRNTPEGYQRFKSHHYLNNILAKRQVAPDAEGIMLTHDGSVAEGIVSNIFFVKDGVLHTPHVQTGILNGITRQWVLQAAQDLGLRVEEGHYSLSSAQASEEVFITNAIQEILPVSQWDEVSYSLDRRVTTSLQEAYQRQIEQNIN
ncbi:aminodeoxychorismate lyase [Caldalkalibacillus salinus]|uniref:aminodeoxychorismate lyase n=1 Tax=Caldalkalibacillus salinus TaxID=2803787 RepID=UPI001920C967|nr:aminodeoxychorismate lyase [Caldalkalibacillus salinus]